MFVEICCHPPGSILFLWVPDWWSEWNMMGSPIFRSLRVTLISTIPLSGVWYCFCLPSLPKEKLADFSKKKKFFLGLHLWHLEVPRLGCRIRAQPAPQPQQQQLGIQATSATYTASLQQRRTLNPLSKARDRTHILMNIRRILNLLSHNRNSKKTF